MPATLDPEAMTEAEIVASVRTNCLEPMRLRLCRPMTETETHFMLGLMTDKEAKAEQMLTDADAPFAVRVAAKRVTVYRVQLDPRIPLFLAVVSGSPGQIVLYLSYIYYWARECRQELVSFGDFCTSIFPMGFLSPEDSSALWGGQKVGISNGLDMAAVVGWLNSPAETESSDGG